MHRSPLFYILGELDDNLVTTTKGSPMAFLRVKRIAYKEYRQLLANLRENGGHKQLVRAHLGMHATLEEAIEDMRERVEALEEEAGLEERQMRRPSAKQRKEYEDRKQRLEDRKRRLRTRLAKLEAVLDRLQEEPRRHNAGSPVSENGRCRKPSFRE